MNRATAETLSKVPAVTLGFWIIKILATTLGETGGDSVSAVARFMAILSRCHGMTPPRPVVHS